MLAVKKLLRLGVFVFPLTMVMCDSPEPVIDDPPPPVVTAAPVVKESDPPMGDSRGGTDLTILGEHFDEHARVWIAGVESSHVQWVSETVLRVTTPASPSLYGLVEVKVQNPDGKSGANSQIFAYYNSNFAMTTVAVEAPSNSQLMTTGDFDGDGYLDMALVAPMAAPPVMSVAPPGTTYGIYIYLGHGDGTFDQQMSVLPIGSWVPKFLMTGDVDGDGRMDLVFDSGYSSVTILYADASGFSSSEPGQITLSNGIESLAIGDLNGDRITDVVIGTTTSTEQGFPNDLVKTVLVYLGKRNRPFEAPLSSTIVERFGTLTVRLGDLDRDGRLDLVYVLDQRGMVGVALGKGDGTFTWKAPLPIGRVDVSPVVIKDVNGDGKLDFLALSRANDDRDHVVYLLGNGDGTFTIQSPIELDLRTYSLAIADINGDCIMDLITMGAPTDKYLSVRLGKGDGTWQERQTYWTSDVTIGSSITVADVHGDGHADLLLLGGWGGSVLILHSGTPPQ